MVALTNAGAGCDSAVGMGGGSAVGIGGGSDVGITRPTHAGLFLARQAFAVDKTRPTHDSLFVSLANPFGGGEPPRNIDSHGRVADGCPIVGTCGPAEGGGRMAASSA